MMGPVKVAESLGLASVNYAHNRHNRVCKR
jgi:hypothetical protein